MKIGRLSLDVESRLWKTREGRRYFYVDTEVASFDIARARALTAAKKLNSEGYHVLIIHQSRSHEYPEFQLFIASTRGKSKPTIIIEQEKVDNIQ